jgi:hypothetical protein
MAIGTGNGQDREPESAERCRLGSDCPFEDSMHQLRIERRNREETDAEICVRLDRLSDELLKAIKMVQAFEATFQAFDTKFQAHLKSHRWIEVVIMGLAAGLGGFLSRLLTGSP